MGTKGFSPGIKLPELEERLVTSICCQGYVDLYIHLPILLHDVVLNQLKTE
jgi:hypothetical protein